MKSSRTGSNRSVLVTGGSGFVGRHVIRALLARGYRVIATHADPPGKVPAAGTRLRWVRWDGTRTPLPRVAWNKLDAIIHLAVPGSLFAFPDNAAALYELEISGTFRLLEAARRYRLRRVLIASTSYVLGTMFRRHRETDCSYRPSTFYGTTKACAELIARAYEGVVSTAVVRFYWPYGPGGDRYLIQRLLRNVADGKEVFVEGRNGMVLNQVWVEDLADGMVRALESNVTGIFHLAGPETLTLRQLINRMGRVLGRRPVIRVKPASLNVNQAADYRWTMKTLGYKPRMRLDDWLRLLANQPALCRSYISRVVGRAGPPGQPQGHNNTARPAVAPYPHIQV